jgi:bacterioferritin-associated ferredoxin
MKPVYICRCEEVTEDEIRQAIAEGATGITGVKRRTGSCMGLCQGRTCRRLIVNMIARETGVNPAEVETATVRPPVRPVTIDALLDTAGHQPAPAPREGQK